MTVKVFDKTRDNDNHVIVTFENDHSDVYGEVKNATGVDLDEDDEHLKYLLNFLNDKQYQIFIDIEFGTPSIYCEDTFGCIALVDMRTSKI